MKKIALLLCGISLMNTVPMRAHQDQYGHVSVEQLTPQTWDGYHFAALNAEQKRDVIGILQATEECFQNMYNAVDKGVDAFLKPLEVTVQLYSQIAMTLTAPGDVCLSMSPVIKELESKLPMIRALEILPSVKDIFDSVTRFLEAKENMTEQDLKRAINKAFRNKEIKTEIKAMLKKQCAVLANYVGYVSKHYPQEVAELAALKIQMQELISKMQENQK
jgi:hypothetical protein